MRVSKNQSNRGLIWFDYGDGVNIEVTVQRTTFLAGCIPDRHRPQNYCRFCQSASAIRFLMTHGKTLQERSVPEGTDVFSSDRSVAQSGLSR